MEWKKLMGWRINVLKDCLEIRTKSIPIYKICYHLRYVNFWTFWNLVIKSCFEGSIDIRRWFWKYVLDIRIYIIGRNKSPIDIDPPLLVPQPQRVEIWSIYIYHNLRNKLRIFSNLVYINIFLNQRSDINKESMAPLLVKTFPLIVKHFHYHLFAKNWK